MDASLNRKIVVVTPLLNDWASLNALIDRLSELVPLSSASLHILAVDDGSSSFEPPSPAKLQGPVRRIQILRLKANQGHQRAIALGLAYAEREIEFDFAVVMDSDGEDRPVDVLRLLQVHEKAPDNIIVARRARRSEGLLFRVFYQVYKLMFRAFTGKPISFGNFSIIPRERLSNVLYNPGVWNNYAATLLRCRIPITFVPTKRGKRYFGSSTMNFSSLMIHGMSAISVFSDIVIGRLIVALCLFSMAFVIGVAAVIGGKLAADYYGWAGYFIPGYTTNVVLNLLNILINALFVGLLMILSLLAARSNQAAFPSTLLNDLTQSVHEVMDSPSNVAQ